MTNPFKNLPFFKETPNLPWVTGPFDVIGDVHGCFEELCSLVKSLGYTIEPYSYNGMALSSVSHPQNRQLFFLGDLIDRGPHSLEVMRLVMGSCLNQQAGIVMGNHDNKLRRHLLGRSVHHRHGFEITVKELETADTAFKELCLSFLEALPSHLVLDDGQVVLAHAGLFEKYHGQNSGKEKALALYGPTTGKIDERGFPERLDWTKDYEGRALVLYGHIPTQDVKQKNNTICLDTGCVFGGKLSAFRYPEKETVSVPALKTYAQAAFSFRIL